jgi:hypothetical protein
MLNGTGCMHSVTCHATRCLHGWHLTAESHAGVVQAGGGWAATGGTVLCDARRDMGATRMLRYFFRSKRAFLA